MKKKNSGKGKQITIERLTAHEAKSILAGAESQWGGKTGVPENNTLCSCTCSSTPPDSPGGLHGGTPNADECTCCCC